MKLRLASALLIALSVASQPEAGLRFEAGPPLAFRHANSPTPNKYLPETMGGGVALFDYDNDGRLDLFFTNGARWGKDGPDKSDPADWNRLYHQNADGSFSDVTGRAGLSGHPEAGYSMGVAVGDYDGDGYRDLFVTGYQHNVLYRNQGDGTFRDATAKAGLRVPGWGASAGFFDYDNDGDLDLLVTRYVEWSPQSNPVCGDRVPGQRAYCHPNHFAPSTSLLFRNNGNGAFTDVSGPAGFARAPGKALGLAFADFDDDGWLDVFIANDSMAGQLFRNDSKGKFVELALEAGVALNEDGQVVAGMGVDFADYDNDGKPDLVVTDLAEEKYLLFRNLGQRQFADASALSGLAAATLPFSGWGIRWVDLDGDGWKDLFVAQGHVLDNLPSYAQPPGMYRNRKGKFQLAPAAGRFAGRGLAIGDIDNDGRPDVVVSNTGGAPYILLNRSEANHWLGIRLEGDGLGARVKVTAANGLTQYFTVTAASSYLSSSDPRLFVGLGAARQASVEVRWPGGPTQRIANAPAGQTLTLRRNPL